MAENQNQDTESRKEEKEQEQKIGLVWKDRKHWMWFPFSFTKYWIENGRLHTERGFFHTTENECLLYRITDVSLRRTLGNKLFGTGTIRLTTRDVSDPTIHLTNIVNPRGVKSMISEMVEKARIDTRSVGRELYGSAHMGVTDMEADPDWGDAPGGHMH